MPTKEYPAVDYIRQCFEYRDGKLFWLQRPRDHFVSDRSWRSHHTSFGGKEAGNRRKTRHKERDDYRWFVSVDGNFKILRSLVVWALHHGEWPVLLVDHVNRNSLDDRIENLRLVTKSQNGANARISCRNSSGYKGVWRHGKKWAASIRVNRVRIMLGDFEDPADAYAAYCAAAWKYFKEFACGG